jgi:hypothetical protein
MSKVLSLSTATFQAVNYTPTYTGTKILGNGKVTYSDHKEYDFTTYSDGEIRLFVWHGRNGTQLVNSPKRLDPLRAYLMENYPNSLPTPYYVDLLDGTDKVIGKLGPFSTARDANNAADDACDGGQARGFNLLPAQAIETAHTAETTLRNLMHAMADLLDIPEIDQLELEPESAEVVSKAYDAMNAAHDFLVNNSK